MASTFAIGTRVMITRCTRSHHVSKEECTQCLYVMHSGRIARPLFKDNIPVERVMIEHPKPHEYSTIIVHRQDLVQIEEEQ